MYDKEGNWWSFEGDRDCLWDINQTEPEYDEHLLTELGVDNTGMKEIVREYAPDMMKKLERALKSKKEVWIEGLED
jgi:hypothetical protein